MQLNIRQWEGTVTIGCKASDDQVQIAVSDTGVGIDKKDEARLFNRF